MKKLLGIIAVVLAIATSAFTVIEKNTDNGTSLDNFYWYTVTYDVNHPGGAVISAGDASFSGIVQTESYANANDGCSGTSKDCLRGFSSVLTSFPNEMIPDAVTTKN